MRPARHITAEEENFRAEPMFPGVHGIDVIKRDPVEPEPVGTIVLKAFRVTGYDQDCDGSLMAQLDNIDKDMGTTGWSPNSLGLYPQSTLVVTEDEWRKMFAAGAGA